VFYSLKKDKFSSVLASASLSRMLYCYSVAGDFSGGDLTVEGARGEVDNTVDLLGITVGGLGDDGELVVQTSDNLGLEVGHGLVGQLLALEFVVFNLAQAKIDGAFQLRVAGGSGLFTVLVAVSTEGLDVFSVVITVEAGEGDGVGPGLIENGDFVVLGGRSVGQGETDLIVDTSDDLGFDGVDGFDSPFVRETSLGSQFFETLVENFHKALVALETFNGNIGVSSGNTTEGSRNDGKGSQKSNNSLHYGKFSFENYIILLLFFFPLF